MNKAKEQSDADGKEFLRSAFAAEQEVLKVQLQLSAAAVTHNGVMGSVNEQHFINVLRKYIPQRYAVDSAIIIDANGNTSDQIDIVIYDRHFTPTLLDQHHHRFIPAEAVYAIFEVKPIIDKRYLEYAADKAASVRKLERTSVAITHAGGEHPPKPLFHILAGIIAIDIEWRDGFAGKSFNGVHSELTAKRQIDCALAASGGSFDIFDGAISIGPGGNSLAHFLFRLLQKLQCMGTVPAVDWNRYAQVMSDEK